MVLKLEGEYEVVGEAGSGTEALRLCRIARPQIVIMDLSLPELSGTHLVRLLMRESWEVRVVVYSGTSDQRLTREALAEMPHGFVRKEDSLPELRTALSWKDEVELALERVWGVVRPTQKATRPIGSVRVASRD